MLNNAQREHPTQASNPAQFVQVRVVQIDTVGVSEHTWLSNSNFWLVATNSASRSSDSVP
jgi:hypothetical protein